VKTIVLGTDGSAGAKLATREAIELARETGWPLRIVAAWTLASWELSAGPIMAPDFVAVAKERAQSALDDAVRLADEAGVGTIPYLRHGEPAEQLCEVADQLGDPLIVVGSHGRGAIGRAMLGSVSTKLAHSARCPVLVVRGAAQAETAGTPDRDAISAGA
jgi:nucleotide-binding universal stress UspA family protein